MGLFSLLFGCRGQKSPADVVDSVEYSQDGIYCGLRNQILSLGTTDLRLSHESDQPNAVLMEIGRPEAVATLVAVADGTASLYFSSGGGIIGCGEHDPVRASALSFVHFAAGFAEEMQPTQSFPLPRKGAVRFYVVTPSEILSAEAIEDDLGNMRHRLSPLFHKGQRVIAAIRENSTK